MEKFLCKPEMCRSAHNTTGMLSFIFRKGEKVRDELNQTPIYYTLPNYIIIHYIIIYYMMFYIFLSKNL